MWMLVLNLRLKQIIQSTEIQFEIFLLSCSDIARIVWNRYTCCLLLY